MQREWLDEHPDLAIEIEGRPAEQLLLHHSHSYHHHSHHSPSIEKPPPACQLRLTKSPAKPVAEPSSRCIPPHSSSSEREAQLRDKDPFIALLPEHHQQALLGVSTSTTNTHLEELSRATRDFADSNLLGEGLCGKVYRGQLADGQRIAVKKIKINPLEKAGSSGHLTSPNEN